VTAAGLAALHRDLDRGPRLLRSAAFGAAVGAIVSWARGAGDGDGGVPTGAAWGAAAGAIVALASHGFKQWSSKSEHVFPHRAGIAPWPLYRPSLSYPWSEH
jgi:hypothetical protein